MLSTNIKNQIATQKGVTMIEVLVSVIVLSIGLLGLAGLQSAGLTHNQSASFRSTATLDSNPQDLLITRVRAFVQQRQ